MVLLTLFVSKSPADDVEEDAESISDGPVLKSENS